MIYRNLRFILIPLFLFCSGLAAQTTVELHKHQTSLAADRLDRYDSYLQNEVDQGRLAGAVTLVYKNGEKAHEKAIGYSNIESKSVMNLNHIFYIQSMTKPIITTAFMMLYEEGHFFLNDPVEKYLPWFKDLKVAVDPNKGIAGLTAPAKSKITIAMLLSHTSGLSHGIAAGKLEEEIRNAIYSPTHENIESRIKTMVTMPLIGQPGKQWYYSASPDVLSLLIEKFSGMTTAEFLQKRLFDPLGMPDTGYNLNEEQASRMASLHTYDKEGKLIKAPRQTPTSGNKIFAGANGLFSTAQDYARFAQMMLNGGKLDGKLYLSPKTVEIMTINQIGDIKREPGQGFGFGFGVTTDLADAKSLGSEGTFYWSGAYCTYFFIDPKESLISIMMTQTAPYSGFYEQKMRQMVYQSIN
jgi:CubicO group peptidase (beta-lactamase class C family)